jgi:DNA-binding NarL/FixJ family response regulator
MAIRVLLVDDSERDLRSLERTLEVVDADLDVVGAAAGGEEAIRLAEATECDVAIVDYRMPGMNGLEVAERLKQLRPSCKVVIITAFDDARGEIEASPHVDHFHEKIALESLGEALREVVGGAPPAAPRKRGLFRRG